MTLHLWSHDRDYHSRAGILHGAIDFAGFRSGTAVTDRQGEFPPTREAN
jgi:hypothetical protein